MPSGGEKRKYNRLSVLRKQIVFNCAVKYLKFKDKIPKITKSISGCFSLKTTACRFQGLAASSNQKSVRGREIAAHANRSQVRRPLEAVGRTACRSRTSGTFPGSSGRRNSENYPCEAWLGPKLRLAPDSGRDAKTEIFPLRTYVPARYARGAGTKRSGQRSGSGGVGLCPRGSAGVRRRFPDGFRRSSRLAPRRAPLSRQRSAG